MPYYSAESAHADRMVAAWILQQYQGGLRARNIYDEDRDAKEHLRSCPDAVATGVDGGDGEYGCDTGCEFVRLAAEVSCPHGERDVFRYADFGTIGMIILELEALDQNGEH